MNKGITHATGEWVHFLNSGDVLHDNNVYDLLNNDYLDYDVIYGYLMIVPRGKPSWCKEYPNIISLEYMLNESLPHLATLYKRKTFDCFKYNESYKIISDWLLNWELMIQGIRFKHINRIVSVFDFTGISSVSPELC